MKIKNHESGRRYVLGQLTHEMHIYFLLEMENEFLLHEVYEDPFADRMEKIYVPDSDVQFYDDVRSLHDEQVYNVFSFYDGKNVLFVPKTHFELFMNFFVVLKGEKKKKMEEEKYEDVQPDEASDIDEILQMFDSFVLQMKLKILFLISCWIFSFFFFFFFFFSSAIFFVVELQMQVKNFFFDLKQNWIQQTDAVSFSVVL